MAEEFEMSMESLSDEDLNFFDEISEEIEETEEVEETEKEIAEEGEENEIEEGEENNENTSSEETDNDDDVDEQLSLFTSALAEEGVLSNEFKEAKIKNFDELAEVIRKQIRQNELAGLTDEQKEYLQALEKGYTHEEFVQTKQQELSLDNITEDSVRNSEDIQRQLLMNSYLSKGYSEDKAKKLTQRSFDAEESESDALDALKEAKANFVKQKELAEANKIKAANERKAQYEKMKDDLKKVVFNEKTEIIPGVRYNPEIADKVYENLTKPAGFDDNGSPLSAIQVAKSKDPMGFEHKLNYLFVLTNGFEDFSKIEKTVGTKKSKDFVNKLNSTQTKTNVGSTSSDDDLMSILDDIDF